MVDIWTNSLKEPVEVVEYLFRRLYEIGVRSVHGVPGDYNLVSLDYVAKCGMKWVGSVNELNAAYAADGYARIRGISALITTFGVGELSAINGVAGAFSEHIPVVHIVGCPSTVSQKNGLLLHHTLGNSDFNVFANMSSHISCAMAKLNDVHDIATQIDETLRECWVQSRPVYLMLPTDMVQRKIEGGRLRTGIDLSEPKNEVEREDFVVERILECLYASKSTVVLVDACAIRHRVVKEVHDVVEKSQLPVFVTPMGKGAIDETNAHYGGVYAGDGSSREVQKAVEEADLILTVGAIKSDFNTAGFSYRTSQLKTVDFHSTYCKVRYAEYPNIRMRPVLQKLAQKIDASRLSKVEVPRCENIVPSKESTGHNQTITHEYLWPRVGGFLREDDVVVTETGTSNFGIWETRFPARVTALSQVLWGSIGWAVGACQGAALAVRDSETPRRTILFVGDGSFQLTAQEVSTMIRHKLNPIIFLICNEGFTIERFIHGMEAEYNDIAPWDFKNLVTVFGGKENTSRKLQVKTRDELEALLHDDKFNAADCLQFVELYMPKEDAPRALVKTAEASAKTNSRLE